MEVTTPRNAGLRSLEDWHDLVRQGRRVMLSWDGGPKCGTVTAQGEVRLLFEETIWIWLDRQLPEQDRPTAGQALQMQAPCEDAMRLIPCQLVDEGRGSSLQVTVSGRLSRLQRREDVRARVDLPPVSAVRLDQRGQPKGLLGLELVDLSASGIRARTGEPIAAGEQSVWCCGWTTVSRSRRSSTYWSAARSRGAGSARCRSTSGGGSSCTSTARSSPSASAPRPPPPPTDAGC
ncbi:MAG TPA: hypothetical protein VFH48_36855 [Chloroflexota bacterium]|nr:hypothetical protein [Chloroflexota bacterium]